MPGEIEDSTATRSTRPANPTGQSDPSATFRSAPVSIPRRLNSLYLRRVFMTLGTLFLIIGAGQWLANADFPFSARNMMWCAIALPALGLLLLGTAAMNILYVKRKLEGRD
jgi:hypothetical protein